MDYGAVEAGTAGAAGGGVSDVDAAGAVDFGRSGIVSAAGF